MGRTTTTNIRNIARCSHILLMVMQQTTTTLASKTFVGTSQDQSLLGRRDLPDDLSVTDIDSVVRRTKLFASHYSPSMITHEEAISNPNYSETELVKDIVSIRGSPVAGDGTIKSSPFGFIGAATLAYGYHKNLIIRPDDIWITILSQFNFYVNGRSEQLRHQFVNFDGQKELTVRVNGYTIYNAPYDDMTLQFLNLIGDNIIDETLKEWFLPGFTTTTKTDELVAAASAMCTFQDYFTYTFEIACGIPKVTLEGTTQDWILLEEKVERIREFDDGTGVLFEWVDHLQTITSNFIESAYNGSENNVDFWDNILYYNSNGYGTPLLSGWITVFSFFDSQGQKMALDPTMVDPVFLPEGVIEYPRKAFPLVDMDDMNANIISCPAAVDDRTTGIKYDATLFVGQMSFEYSEEESTDVEVSASSVRTVDAGTVGIIKPRNDWALVIENGEIEMERPTEMRPLPLPKFPAVDYNMNVEICYWYEHLQFTSSSSSYQPIQEPALDHSTNKDSEDDPSFEEIEEENLVLDEEDILEIKESQASNHGDTYQSSSTSATSLRFPLSWGCILLIPVIV